MELLARERAAEQNVRYYLKATEEPIVNVLQAFEECRQACLAGIFADFDNNSALKARWLWQIHTEGKKYFHRALSGLRKQSTEQPVAVRQLIKFYLQFIKDSQRFYRDYIYRLNTTFGGIPELQAVAHQVRNEAVGESSSAPFSLELRQKVLESCHQTLIYLGDLSRYRASDRLDKTPDFGPAIGYYGLACTLIPSSGMGHHQLAVIALEQRQHLRAIYYLYRAMVVDDPHPNAANNLKLEFDKTNAAWDRGELIQKGPSNDPETSKRTLIGWFVRLHSMCFKGEPFRGQDELEREVQGQLAAELKQRPLDSTLMRMVLINLSAQYNAGLNFQETPTQQNQNAFINFFKVNIKTFTTLLHIFYDSLKTADSSANEADDIDLASKLTETSRRVLPALRLYSSWLLTMVHLLDGLSGEQSLKAAIDQFWRVYARSVDLVATVFQIWDLEDLPEISYLFEEDADTIGFKPLTNDRTNKIWFAKQNGMLKPRFSDFGIERASADDEMLTRVKDFLSDGLFLANDDDDAPIKLRGERVLHKDVEEVEDLPASAPVRNVTVAKPTSNVPSNPPKPLSYAAAAATRPSPTPAHSTTTNGVSSMSSTLSRDAQLSRMVDDLVDDDESNNPVTPPQQHSSHPVVVSRGDLAYPPVQEDAQLPTYTYSAKQPPIGTPAAASSPSHRSPKVSITTTSLDRLQTLSNLWNDASAHPLSSFPTGLPTGTLSSPAQLNSRGHSRVNSASSIRSRTSQTMNMGIADSWSPSEFAARSTMPAGPTVGFAGGFGNADQSVVASPLLFGAGGGVWSTRPGSRGRNPTPPSGQGG